MNHTVRVLLSTLVVWALPLLASAQIIISPPATVIPADLTPDSACFDEANQDICLGRAGPGMLSITATGLTNNENLIVDAETIADAIGFQSTTGVTDYQFYSPGFTGDTDYARLVFDTTHDDDGSSVFSVRTETGGTADNIVSVKIEGVGANASIFLAPEGTNIVQITSSGLIDANAGNHDIGGATREWKDAYFTSEIFMGGFAQDFVIDGDATDGSYARRSNGNINNEDWILNLEATANTAAYSSATGVVEANYGGIIGFAGNPSIVEVVTTSKTPVATECSEVYTNTGDGDGTAFTLVNDPPLGCIINFIAMEAQTMTIDPNAGETIEANGSVCTDVRIGAAIGEALSLQAGEGGSGGVWVPVGGEGGFTCT